MKKSTIIVNEDKTKVMADSTAAAYYMHAGGIISFDEELPIQINRWYDIAGTCGQWSLEYDFPCRKEDDYIDVVYE